MGIYQSKMIMKGSLLDVESPIPVLRDLEEHRTLEVYNMPDELADSIGHYCGYRVLPYKMQNHYTRSKNDISLKTIILENNHIKATFLPEYGGRLYSLFNKDLNRELLSVNPVFQPANLGLRNAWFSGGIEWNMAHFGHSYLTCDLVHFGMCLNEDGEEVLRLYEYERTKKLYYQVDFYLPDDADYLVTYTKIFNINKEASPLYYWSNTAVSELNNARVFSSTEDVIYIKPYCNEKGEMINTFSYGQVPYLEGIEGDVSYPRNFDRSNEHFYQTKEDTVYPWEAVGYDDGFVFFECSTHVLRYRKMFCWGKHNGGTKWQDYLSEPDKDKYVEIQAGIFPSQLHSQPLDAESSVGFMQIFGGNQVKNPSNLYQDLDQSSHYVSRVIFDKLSSNTLKVLENKMIVQSDHELLEILHHGKGWGSLESIRLEVEGEEFNIKSMRFEQESLTEEQDFFLNILHNDDKKAYNLNNTPLSYMVDLNWEKYLVNSSMNGFGNKEMISLHLALMYSENNQNDKAIDIMISEVEESYSSLYFMTLAALYKKLQMNEQAYEYYKLAYDKLSLMSVAYYKEDFLHDYLNFLFEEAKYEEAWEVFESIDFKLTEELQIEGAKIAYELKKYGYVTTCFDMELERIREGNNTLVELWFKMKALELNTTDLKYVRNNFTPPGNIDFRML
ncbi:MAG: DUF5107 domain-containing protein [Clostridiales bacterium]|nr:DUF5107 domain-containing protein [Clostridiales bacterium]